jgi:UDP-N-acetylglucosamine--N-acetylmuramyl-(pentapeptide) pyrophosphoryl-undecaprenol N-acetylglucosamine transferase
MTVAITGGGTGGHVIPAIAVAGELRQRGHEAVFIGTRAGMEAVLVPREGFLIEYIEIGGLNSVGLGRQLRTLAMLPGSILRSRAILHRLSPRVLFSMGGYVAAPPMIAARWSRIPIAAMEPNAMPGLVTRKLRGWIDRALISFEETRAFLPGVSTELTGLPVRRAFFDIAPRPPGTPRSILVTGGSQGSRRLNEACQESWELFAQAGWPVRFVHQAGRLHHQAFAASFRAAGVPGEAAEFIPAMPAAFAAADLVVCRAGAGAVAELAAAGKPAILVPYPFAADDHQAKNAAAMERAGAARVIRDAALNGRVLFDAIQNLSAGDLAAMSAAARRLARPGAAERAASILEELAQ